MQLVIQHMRLFQTGSHYDSNLVNGEYSKIRGVPRSVLETCEKVILLAIEQLWLQNCKFEIPNRRSDRQEYNRTG